MNLAIWHNQPPGGARRALHEFGKQLAQRHEIDVFTLSSAEERFLPSSDFARRVIVAPYARRRHVRLGLYLNDLRTWLDLRDLATASRLVAAQINAGSYDAVLVDVDRFLGAPFVLRYLELPNAYYCHEPPRRHLEPICRPEALPLSRWERARLLWRWPSDRLLGWLSRRAERANGRQAGRILTNSHYNRSRIQQYYGRQAMVCYPGVDGDFFRPDEALPRRHEVLSVGALEPHKGFDFLIRAVARCHTRPALRLVGGSGHPRMAQHLQALAAQLGVNLKIETAVSDPALRRRYCQAALMAYTPHFEPFGLAPLEAMACGTPVVGVAEGGVLESVTDGVTGLLAPRDAAQVAAAIDELLADEARRQRMGQAGRADVKRRWTWEAAASRVESQLAAVAGAGREALL